MTDLVSVWRWDAATGSYVKLSTVSPSLVECKEASGCAFKFLSTQDETGSDIVLALGAGASGSQANVPVFTGVASCNRDAVTGVYSCTAYSYAKKWLDGYVELENTGQITLVDLYSALTGKTACWWNGSNTAGGTCPDGVYFLKPAALTSGADPSAFTLSIDYSVVGIADLAAALHRAGYYLVEAAERADPATATAKIRSVVTVATDDYTVPRLTAGQDGLWITGRGGTGSAGTVIVKGWTAAVDYETTQILSQDPDTGECYAVLSFVPDGGHVRVYKVTNGVPDEELCPGVDFKLDYYQGAFKPPRLVALNSYWCNATVKIVYRAKRYVVVKVGSGTPVKIIERRGGDPTGNVEADWIEYAQRILDAEHKQVSYTVKQPIAYVDSAGSVVYAGLALQDWLGSVRDAGETVGTVAPAVGMPVDVSLDGASYYRGVVARWALRFTGTEIGYELEVRPVFYVSDPYDALRRMGIEIISLRELNKSDFGAKDPKSGLIAI